MAPLSIVIVTYNSRRDLEPCLRSLTEHPPSIDHEVVVVDNASNDGTPAYLRERWAHIRLLEAKDNIGFARANNLGIRQTSGALVLLLNPDTLVPAGAVANAVLGLDG